MAQQINLFSPVVQAPKQVLSARSVSLTLAMLAAALLAGSAWMLASSAALRREVLPSVRAQAGELDRLTRALAAEPTAAGAALEQELAQAQGQLAQRRVLLDELMRGRAVQGRSHAAMLRMVAQTLPAAAWLNDIRVIDGRIELEGLTLQPDALRPWLARLADHPSMQGQRVGAVKLERLAPGATAAATAGRAATANPLAQDVWAFSIASEPAPHALVAGDAAVAEVRR